ncbi:ferredoxin [Amycolatopsis sp. QT-25]|uniref:ferredoxin n=1 Tax=Amycolatopsis sp. QT-25 TaxID=3034022 RepID=UPI0023EC6CA4|nr:ferredoxin [Amycolatopsis sp. QT-25]WET78555.1 ferredoxin [Amycolatopsis sp. QT-25]
MTTPPAPFGPEQQQQIVAQIGNGLASMAPPGWRRLRTEHRAVGRHLETDVLITGPDGTTQPIAPPPELVQLLGTLRAGMYQPGQGTWLGMTLTFDAVQGTSVDFTLDQEPAWRRTPPPIGFQDELRFFPRADQYLPPWLRQRAGLEPAPVATPPAKAPEALKSPRVYDGLDESGRPVVNREPLPPAERDRVLEYLDGAPVVLASRTYDADAFDPERESSVPLNFRTDGRWYWPGAVAYYLREHDVAPDPELLGHIRALRFTLPEVGEPERALAIAAITGQPST